MACHGPKNLIYMCIYIQMESAEIIKSIHIHKKITHTDFLDECENYIKKFAHITKIPENSYAVESIRINLLYNKYNLYVCDSKNITQETKQLFTYREFTLGKKAVDNMFRQINALNNNSIDLLCDNLDNYQITNPVLVISKDEINIKDYVEIINPIDVGNFMLGIESISILEHQDLDRFCSYTRSEKREIQASTQMFKKFYKCYRKLDLETKERMMLISGMILHSLGTTYTSDLDLIFNGEHLDKQIINEIIEKITTYTDSSVDYHVFHNNKIIKRTPVADYLYDWLYSQWANLVGKKTMFEVMADPEHFYYFMGIKFIGTKMTIQRLIKRSAPSSFVDLIMLKKINHYDSIVCFPNLSVRNGSVTIYTDKEIEKKLYTVKKYFKDWHGINYTIEELKNQIVKCNTIPYVGSVEKFAYSSDLVKYNNIVIRSYIKHFFKGKELLIIGSSSTNDLDYYNHLEIPKVITLDPSDSSESNNYLNMHLDMKHELIQGSGNEIWKSNGKYNAIIRSKSFDCILLKFSIHYMYKNIRILLTNINQIDNDNTIVIVCFIDGTAVKEKLKKNNGKYEIMFKGEPIYGIYNISNNKNNFEQIMVYFRGIRGANNGYIEYIVDSNWLISQFAKINYRVLLNKNLLEISNDKLIEIRDKLVNEQKQISNLYRIIVFKKSINMKDGNLNSDYYQNYIKYKGKYTNLKKKFNGN